jgi:hypothetical protein
MLLALPAVLTLLLSACGCPPKTENQQPRTVHFDEWPRLVDAVARGDRGGARRMARDLGAEPELADAEQMSPLGGALGFMQVASDGEDLADGLTEAAEACGSCHGARAVAGPRRPVWSHATAARWAVWPLTWDQEAALPPEHPGEPVTAAAECFREGGAEALLANCQGCHEGSP